MDAMTLPRHARKNWTKPQVVLGAACAVLGAVIAVLGFIDIFVTVNHLLAPYWGWAAWTVIVLGEGSFTGSYLGWLLLDLRDHPPRRVLIFLVAYLTGFAAGSLALQLYAGWGTLPDVVSHAIVVAAFFGYLIFAKVLVRRLSADPAKRALEEALADARQYAMDLARSLRGRLWRWRVPALLKRQILSGRFPDEVREAVEAVVASGRNGGWQASVREWVTGPDGLNLTTQAQVSSQQAVSDITRNAAQVPSQNTAGTPPGAPPRSAPQTPPANVPGDVSQIAPGTSPRRSPNGVRKPSPSAVKRMSPADLAPYVGTLLEATPGLTPTDVMRVLKVGRAKADEALKAARRDRLRVAAGRA